MRFLIILFSLFTSISLAQKPVVDLAVCNSWPKLGALTTSNDGKYVIYDIQNVPFASYTLILQSTYNRWKKEFIGGLKYFEISGDSKSLFYISGGDSLAILRLGSNQIKYISDVSNFTLGKNKSEGWIFYTPAISAKSLVIMNLKTKKKMTFNDVVHFEFSEDGSILILKQHSKSNAKNELISWIDIGKQTVDKFWDKQKVDKYILDSKNSQLAFIVDDSVFHYKVGSAVTCLKTKIYAELPVGFYDEQIDHFSKDGKRIFINFKQKEQNDAKTDGVEIWSYLDLILQSERSMNAELLNHTVVLDLKSLKFIPLQAAASDQFYYPKLADEDSLALVIKEERLTEKWSIACKIKSSLLSTKSGKAKDLAFLEDNRTVTISDSGKFLVYYNTSDQDFISYEISTGKTRNITSGLNVDWINSQIDDNPAVRGPRGLAGWEKNDKAVFIYDRNDIWRLDPMGKSKPVNITNGYGRQRHIIFTIMFPDSLSNDVSKDRKIFLNTFNQENKNDGFYFKRFSKTGNPELLSMGPFLFDTKSGYVPTGSNFPIIKAKCSSVYIVRRMSALQAPNYFSTADFKNFTKLSNLQPQKQFNWYTTELHSWESLDGRKLQGILYKPENFDSTKKYPVIFNFYERKSDGLNAYITPEALCGGCNINIPMYVSQGYLVFAPDIYYRVGDPMQGTFDAIVSAANYLSKFDFVNSKKMGLQGCSFGGIQTNYLIANTNIFVAACSAVGFSNWISTYGALIDGRASEQNIFENGQTRMGASLWEKMDIYLKNSPVLQLDRVNTPLLMMNNKKDGVIPYSDAIGFFTGLRRLGKKAWLLSYPNGGHSVRDNEAIDFSARMMQYFNHFLKDRSSPLWMTKGIINNGFDYEIDTTTPGAGILKLEEKIKVDSLMTKR